MKIARAVVPGLVMLAAGGGLTAQVNGPDDLRTLVRSSISASADGSNGKCGTAFRMAWRAEHLSGRSGADAVWDDRPVRQRSRLSPSGRFRVHYDTTGIHEPALLNGLGIRIAGTANAYADSTVRIFDRVWEQIVSVLGYESPPADTGGGDAAYDVYLSDLPPEWFGQTVFEEPIPGLTGPTRWRTYMEIDNDFAGLRTPGIAGLRITAAHEYFHAVQVGAYGVWDDDDFYFYELTSVWMETALESDIEDYLFDLPKYFSDFSGLSLAVFNASYRGYERSVFALFLEERFGRDALLDVWRSLRSRRVLPALDHALETRGTGLRSAFREFALWNHRTHDRAAGAVTYRQAGRFPRMSPSAAMSWTPPAVRLGATAGPMSHATLDLGLTSDTLSTIVVNTDFIAASRGSLDPQAISLSVSNTAPDGGGQQVGGLWFSISVPFADEWSHEVVSAVGRAAVPLANDRPWPSPWNLSDDADLVIPVGSTDAPETVAFVSAGQTVVPVERWNLETQRATRVARIPVGPMRDRLSSGVYVVLLRRGTAQQLWKIAVVR
jgi:hypothetical protein